MNNLHHKINLISQHQIDNGCFTNRFVSCLVLSKDNRMILQQRGNSWKSYPGFLSEFGGHIEVNELPIHALIRELKEELGAQVEETDVISLGIISITVEATNICELVYGYFWQDKVGTITGCYEGEAKYYTDVSEIYQHPKIMLSTLWLIDRFQSGLYRV